MTSLHDQYRTSYGSKIPSHTPTPPLTLSSTPTLLSSTKYTSSHTTPILPQRLSTPPSLSTPLTLSSPTPPRNPPTLHTNLYAPLSHRVLPTRTSVTSIPHTTSLNTPLQLSTTQPRHSSQHTLDKVLDKVKKTLNENAMLRERTNRSFHTPELDNEYELNFERSPSPVLPHQKRSSYLNNSWKQSYTTEPKIPLTTSYLSNNTADFMPKEREAEPANEDIIRMLEVNRKKYQDLMQKLADADTRLMVNKERYNEVKKSLAVALKNLELENSPHSTSTTSNERSNTNSIPQYTAYNEQYDHKSHNHANHSSLRDDLPPPPSSRNSKSRSPITRTSSPPIPPHHYSRSNTPSPTSDLMDSDEEYAIQTTPRSSHSSPTNRSHKPNNKYSNPPSPQYNNYYDSPPPKHASKYSRDFPPVNGYHNSEDQVGYKSNARAANGRHQDRSASNTSDSEEDYQQYQPEPRRSPSHHSKHHHRNNADKKRQTHDIATSPLTDRSIHQPTNHTNNSNIDKDERIRRLEEEMAALKKLLEQLKGGAASEQPVKVQQNMQGQRKRSTTDLDPPQQYFDDLQGQKKHSTTEYEPPYHHNSRALKQGVHQNGGPSQNEPPARTTRSSSTATRDSSSSTNTRSASSPLEIAEDDVSDDSDDEVISFLEPPRNPTQLQHDTQSYANANDVYGTFARGSFGATNGGADIETETESGEEVMLASRTLEEKIRGL